MRLIHYMAVSAVAVSTLTVTGCAQVQDRFEQTFSDRGDRYCLQAGGLGALAGGAVGAGIGYAATKSGTGALVGGLIGGIGSAIAGCRYGIWVADRRKAYESEQAQLNAELKNAADTNRSLAELNSKLRAGITEREEQLALLEKAQIQAAQKHTAKKQLVQELATNRQGIATQLEQAEKELAVHQQTLTELRKSDGEGVQSAALTDAGQVADREVSAAQLAEYKKRIEEMKQAVAELRGLNQQYARADSRIAKL